MKNNYIVTMDRAFSTPDVVANATPVPTGDVKRGPEPPKGDVEFNQRDFTLETGTANVEKVAFDETMQLEVQTQLENSLHTLVDLFNDDPASEIFTSNRLSFLPKMMETMCDKNEHGGFKLNPNKIKEGLKKDPRVWKEAMQLIEFDLSLTEMALALEAQINPNELNVFLMKKGKDKQDSHLSQPDSIQLGINKGKLNGAVAKHLGGLLLGSSSAYLGGTYLSSTMGSVGVQSGISAAINMLPVGRAAVAAGVNALGATGLGSLAGVGIGLGTGVAAVGLYNAARSALSRGITIDMQRNTELLQLIQNESRFSAEKQYLEKVLHVNVSDYKVTDGKVELAHDKIGPVQRSADIKRIESQFVDKILTRFNILSGYESNGKDYGLGIPPERVTAVPDNLAIVKSRLFRGQRVERANNEPINTTWKQAEADLIDSLIQQRRLTDPGYPASTADMYELMFDARRLSMDKSLNAQLREAQLRKGPDQNQVARLRGKLDSYTKDTGSAVEKKTRQLKEVKQALQESKPQLTTDQTNLESYRNARHNLERVRAEAQRKLGFSSIDEIKREIKSRTDLPAEELNTLLTELQTAESQLESTRQSVENIERQFDDSRTRLESWVTNTTTGIDIQLRNAGLTPVGLSLTDFQTLTIDEIVSRINKAHQLANSHTPPFVVGWPASENGDQNKRRDLLYVIAEAKAQRELAVATPSADFNRWKRGGVSEYFMRTATVDTLYNELDRRRLINVRSTPTISPSNPTDRARLENVLNESRLRFGARSNALKDVLAHEPGWVQNYNTNRNVDRARFDTYITRLREESRTLATEEAALEQLRNNEEIANQYIDSHLNDHLQAANELNSWHARLSGVAGYAGDLDLSTLAGVSIDDLRRRIHTANTLGVTPPIGWPPALDTDKTTIRFLLSAHSEIQVRQKLPETPKSASEQLKRLHITEFDLLHRKPKDIIDLINARGAKWKTDKSTENFVQQAIDLEKNRMAERKRQLANDITTFQSLDPSFANADIAYLELRGDYRNTVAKLSSHMHALAVAGMPRTSTELEAEARRYETTKMGLVDMTDMSPVFQQELQTIENYQTQYGDLLSKRINAQTRAQVQTASELQIIRQRRESASDADLQDLQTRLQIEQDNLANNTEVVQNAQEKTSAMRSAAMNLENIGAASPVISIDLSAAALRTLSFEDIMKRVNESYEQQVAAGIPNPLGWAQSENIRPDMRQMVMNAMAEARADITSIPGITVGLGILDHFQYVQGWFTDYQIQNMTPAELLVEVRYRDPTTPFNENDMREVIEASHKIFDARLSAHQQVVAEIDARDKVFDQQIASAKDEVAKDGIVVEQAIGMMENQGKIYSRAHTLLFDIAKGKVDLTRTRSSTNYVTPEELQILQSTTPPMPDGVLVMLNLFTGYQDKSNRGELAAKLLNTQDFSPQQLALRANYAASLGLSPPNDRDPTAVFAELQRRITTSTAHERIKADDMYTIATRIVNDYIQVAEAR